MAVLRGRLPLAGFAQRLVARHLLHHRRRLVHRDGGGGCGNAGPGLRRRQTLLVQLRGQERVGGLHPDAALKLLLGGAGDRRSLVGCDMQRHPAHGEVSGALDHRQLRRLLGIPGYHQIAPGRPDADHTARGGNGGALVLRHVAQPHIGLALSRRHTQRMVVQRGHINLGLLVQHDVVRADFQLHGRLRLGPERVARGDRVIQRCGLPCCVVSRVERHRAQQPGQTAHAGWRIDRRLLDSDNGCHLRRIIALRERQWGGDRPQHHPADGSGSGQPENCF